MLDPFESRGFGIGPQINFFFPVGEKIEGVANVKVYDEFGAQKSPVGLERLADALILTSPAASGSRGANFAQQASFGGGCLC